MHASGRLIVLQAICASRSDPAGRSIFRIEFWMHLSTVEHLSRRSQLQYVHMRHTAQFSGALAALSICNTFIYCSQVGVRVPLRMPAG
jgi:hypothetical protein